jgi:RNA polymerase-binding protein DksA
MRARDLSYFRRLLQERLSAIVKDMTLIEQHSMILKSAQPWSGPLNSNHLSDLVSDAAEREKAFLFASRDGASLSDIRDALRRIEEGTFGTCLRCGGEIPVERLKAVPNTTMCITCKALEDRRRKGLG